MIMHLPIVNANQEALTQPSSKLCQFSNAEPEIWAFLNRFFHEVQSNNLVDVQAMLTEDFYFDPGTGGDSRGTLVERVQCFVYDHQPKGIASFEMMSEGRLRIATFTDNTDDPIYGDMSIEVVVGCTGLRISKILEGFQAVVEILTGKYHSL